MQISKDSETISLTIPIPLEVDTIKILSRPEFIQIQEIQNGSARQLEIICKNSKYLSSFEAFCDLVEMNVHVKHLPALSVFINILRVWNWEEFRKTA